MVDTAGAVVGTVDAVELVTVGQRRGVGSPGGHEPRYVLDVDVPSATVTVGSEADLLVDVDAGRCVDVGRRLPPAGGCWPRRAPTAPPPRRTSTPPRGEVRWVEPRRRVAPGQLVVLYDGDEVVGSAPAR